MANPKHFEKALGVVMREVLDNPDEFKLERNRHNSKTMTVTVYKSHTRAVEIAVKTSGVILMVADKNRVDALKGQLKAKYKDLKSWDKRPILCGAQYGYKEKEEKESGNSTNTSASQEVDIDTRTDTETDIETPTSTDCNHPYRDWIHDFRLL